MIFYIKIDKKLNELICNILPQLFSLVFPLSSFSLSFPFYDKQKIDARVEIKT